MAFFEMAWRRQICLDDCAGPTVSPYMIGLFQKKWMEGFREKKKYLHEWTIFLASAIQDKCCKALPIHKTDNHVGMT